MPRSPVRRRRALGPAVLALTLLLPVATSCARGPQASALPEASHEACRAVAALWPAGVGGQERRRVRVDGGSGDSAAAWGEPAIIARCGAQELQPTADQCLRVNGVDWILQPLPEGHGMRLTTYGRSPALEVLVPSAYQPEPLLLPAFTDAAQALPATGRQCV